ncbi:MAG: hypothetical protein F6K28_43570, partial [Microcoleus sp. SIO2G3]|nr:hypothetical protein [Microcoleus sp. SIO2G3]
MTFPLPTSIPQGIETNWASDPESLKKLRQAFIQTQFIEQSVDGNSTAQQLAQIAQVLGRSASNESTAYENGAVTTSATSSASQLTRQVERALTQVLGRAPGRGTDGFMQALNAAFPTNGKGQVMSTPARSVVSLYSSSSTETGKSLTGQLSVEQANLHRQASIIVADALRVLENMESFEPTADQDAVEALRSLVQAQFNSLAEEFGRLDEPRRDRVNILFKTLQQSLQQLGIISGLGSDTGINPNLVTTEDESQVAAFELVKSYASTLEEIWKKYTQITGSERVSGSYSDRLSRVSVMLPVIADSNASLMAAMDSVGFTESERRSNAAAFNSLTEATFNLNLSNPNGQIITTDPSATINQLGRIDLTLPNITVNDFSDWIDRFTTLEAPSLLSTSGRYGLEFVTDQADTLFWVIGLLWYYFKTQNDA